MRGRIAVLTALAGLVLVAGAQADTRKVGDARGDTKGSHWPGPGFVWGTEGECAGSWVSTETGSCGENVYFENAGPLLDITSVSHAHRSTSLVHRLSTARTWRNALLSANRGGQISFYFDTDSDAAFERRLDLYFQGGKLRGVMRNGAGRAVARLVAKRPNARTVEVSFPRSRLGRGVHVEWFAFAGITCKRKYALCGDRSPGARLITHHLG